MLKRTLFLITVTITGCVSLPPDRLPITTEKREFLYDYTVGGATKDQLYTRANDFLATSFRNSKLVSRVEDKDRGTIIGKAVAEWGLTIDSLVMPCYSNYDIYIIAKDGRARLQLALVEGAPNPSVCGWTLPSKHDYPQIVSQFDAIARDLRAALNGQGKLDRLNDF